jgi:pimeloyl-ACP methyl ester carboxylesterase
MGRAPQRAAPRSQLERSGKPHRCALGHQGVFNTLLAARGSSPPELAAAAQRVVPFRDIAQARPCGSRLRNQCGATVQYALAPSPEDRALSIPSSLVMPSRLQRLFFAAALALGSITCLGLAPAHAQEPTDDTFALQEGAYLAQHYVHPAIRWAPCPQAAGVECGTLATPIDYRRPHNGSFDMALMRAKASNPAQRIGTLVVTFGGPSGGSAVDGAIALLGQPNYMRLRARFDIVAYDARGTGRSRRVQCDVKPVGRPAENASNESLVGFFDSFGRGLAEACLKQNGPFLTTVSTNNVARDMDVLRRALGERQISFYGPSYSSMVGAVYASLFPQHVRAMVLDGVRAPETRDYVMETISETFAGTERPCTGWTRSAAKAPPACCATPAWWPRWTRCWRGGRSVRTVPAVPAASRQRRGRGPGRQPVAGLALRGADRRELPGLRQPPQRVGQPAFRPGLHVAAPPCGGAFRCRRHHRHVLGLAGG